MKPSEFKKEKRESKTVEVRKEFILKAHKEACADWKERIRRELPELFENKLEVGKWYKKDNNKILTFFNGMNEESYGFPDTGGWITGHYWFNEQVFEENFGENGKNLRLATSSEVMSALWEEAISRGYKNNMPRRYDSNENTLSILNEYDVWKVIFYNGKWVEPKLPESLQTAIKELGKEEILKLLKR